MNLLERTLLVAAEGLLTMLALLGLFLWHRQAVRQSNDLVARQVEQRENERRETMRRVMVSLARRLQASSVDIQREAAQIRENLPLDCEAAAEASDHVQQAAAQQARHALSVMTLAGERVSWRRFVDEPLVEVVLAAAGSVASHGRVHVSGDPSVAVTAPGVEPLTHLVAELLDNALQFSPATAPVHVSVIPVHRGAVLEIVDAGVGLHAKDLDRYNAIVSGEHPLDLSKLDELGEPPRLGLAVVGCYARRHQLKISLRRSPSDDGTQAVVLVPAGLVTTLPSKPTPNIEALDSRRVDDAVDRLTDSIRRTSEEAPSPMPDQAAPPCFPPRPEDDDQASTDSRTVS